ncbi:MAG TPA: GNAT family N-acetyltransferase [Polyangiaceae bacterium]|jgi:ribosomal protein S18 acetylase RimI-like enzyme|nr:GNAT family N-acetyltransferase [Polyangiaceae bacterium]
MTQVHVRRARESDVPAAAELAGKLARLHHQTDPGRFFLPDDVVAGYSWWFRRELAREGAVLLVAERAAEGRSDPGIAGYAYGALGERDWNLLLDEHGAIHDLYVADEERRSGVGAALLTALVEALEALGATRIVLSTMPSNVNAQHLFARHGFRTTFLEMTRNSAPKA